MRRGYLIGRGYLKRCGYTRRCGGYASLITVFRIVTGVRASGETGPTFPFIFKTSGAPTAGSCIPEPLMGDILTTLYSLNCIHFSDPDGPITYTMLAIEPDGAGQLKFPSLPIHYTQECGHRGL